MTPGQPLRVAFYARYSSDRQNERSIDDQLRLLREYAARQGWVEVLVFTDYEISGELLINRPGALAMLEASRAGGFDVLVAEHLDRVARNQEDTAHIYNRLTRRGQCIHTLSGGEVTSMRVAFEGWQAADFRVNLAAKVHRGQRGSVETGKFPGGLAFGYRIPALYDAKGERVRGLREIDPDQAAIVRRIFADYLAGKSARAIAKALNAEGVPGPHGRKWNDSTINGNRARRTGILFNALYDGRLVWNRTRASKDPDTGRQSYSAKPVDTWIETALPDLRIVDAATWKAAQIRKTRYAEHRPDRARRPKRLLSGLIECGVCGGAYTVIGLDRIGCSSHRRRHDCANGTTFYMTRLEDRALDGLKSRLLDPAIVAAYVAKVHRRAAELRADRAQHHADAARRLAIVSRQIAGLMTAIEDGLYTAAMKTRMAELEFEKTAIEREIAAVAPLSNVISLTPRLTDAYRARIADLGKLLASPEGETRREHAVAMLRSLVRKIVIRPGARQSPIIELHGDLPAALAMAAGTQQRTATVLYASDGWGGTQPPLAYSDFPPLVVNL